MVSSMTGYGRGQAADDRFSVTVEVKSVNHRYFEFSARVPRSYAFLEERLKSFFAERIARGKVDLFLSVESLSPDGVEVEINAPLAAAYVAALRRLGEDYGLADDISVSTVARYSDLFTVRKAEVDEEALWSVVSAAAQQAAEAFLAMRSAEGEKLAADLNARGEEILSLVGFVEQRSPETVRAYRERIEQKIRELLDDAQVDEQRLLTETAIFADKVAVAEETVRLRSHIAQMNSLLCSKEPAGRKLDFLVQEMNREANTIGSKAQDVEITRRVVDIKSTIEKIREQVQNIE